MKFFLEFELIDYVGTRSNGSGILPTVLRRRKRRSENMDLEEALLTIPINPNNFPAKLWRLVNNPQNSSIRWDPSGESVIINQQQFEAELLSPQKNTFETLDLFKTTNFTSFIRQLNLYGFRKVIGSGEKQSDGNSSTEGIQHHFHNQNFKQCHPELLVNLKRLTSSNKAKMEAGLEVNCRPPNRFRRLVANGDVEDRLKVVKRGSAFVGQAQRAPPHPYHPSRSQPMKEYNRTPVPPRGWIMGHGDAPTPTTFYTDKGIPISVIHRFPTDTSCGVQSNPATVHIQQGAQGLVNPGQKFNSFIPHHPQYRPGFYSPAVCQCCPPSPMDHDLTSAHQTPAPYSHYSYYQPNCPMGFLYPGNQNQDWQSGENQDTKKNDVNLDRVFQIVDELQASPKIHMVKVETPEKQSQPPSSSEDQPVSSIHSCVSSHVDTSLSSSSMPVVIKANSVTPHGPIIIAVSGNVPQGTVSGPAGEPEDVETQPLTLESKTTHAEAYHKEEEFSSSEVEETELLHIEVTNSLHDASVMQDSSITRKQTKSPDLNMLVEVACKQES
ncbi:heat shock factor protein 5 isoform X3 [Osmerus eperlanus]|uniref:heat shock factor protein 5 isoform X3 n=1 Tax=Osmerus eperlanus TaxID=29151 RepID=UPI002E137D04